MGSETELTMRLGQQGHKAWHVRGAVVEHFVRKEQLKKAWAVQRAILFGRGQYRLFSPEEASNAKSWAGVPRYLFRRMFKQAILLTAARIRFEEEALFRAHWRLNFLRGKAMEARAKNGNRFGERMIQP